MAGSRVYREFPFTENVREGGQRPLLSTAQLNIALEDESIIVPVEAKLIVSGSVIFVCTKCQPDSESGAGNCWERSGLHIIQHEQVSSVYSVLCGD